MKNLELPGLIPTEKPKPVPTPTPWMKYLTKLTTEEKEPWVWCPPAFDIELDYQHPDFPKKFINRQLLVKNCRKPENDGSWKLYESYFLDELVCRKIDISREKIRGIIEEYYK